MKTARLLVLAIAFAACTTRPAESGLLLVEALPPRTLRSDYPEEAAVVLESFLDSLAPAVTEVWGGRALIREGDWGTVSLTWGVEDDRLRVQAVDVSGGAHPAEVVAALAYHLRVAGVPCSVDRFSGCRLPASLAESLRFGEALDAVFAERGLVRVDQDIGLCFNRTFFGRPGGSPTWHVDLTWAARADPDTIEFFHSAAMFDVVGEEEILLEFLEKLSPVPVAFGQRTDLAEVGYWEYPPDD